MKSGDGERRETETAEFSESVFMLGQIAFVDRDETGKSRLVDESGNFLIGRMDSGQHIHRQNHDRGIGQSHVDLGADSGLDCIALNGFIENIHSAGIDEREPFLVVHDLADQPVPGDAALIMDNGDAFSGDTVEYGGLADVRSADNGHNSAFGFIRSIHDACPFGCSDSRLEPITRWNMK